MFPQKNTVKNTNYLGVLKDSGGNATLEGLLQVEIGGLGVSSDLNHLKNDTIINLLFPTNEK